MESENVLVLGETKVGHKMSSRIKKEGHRPKRIPALMLKTEVGRITQVGLVVKPSPKHTDTCSLGWSGDEDRQTPFDHSRNQQNRTLLIEFIKTILGRKSCFKPQQEVVWRG